MNGRAMSNEERLHTVIHCGCLCITSRASSSPIVAPLTEVFVFHSRNLLCFKLSEAAQTWADELASRDVTEHQEDESQKMGENIFEGKGPGMKVRLILLAN